MIRILAIAVMVSFLGGCMQTLTGTVAGGESKVFQAPPYAVKGKTPYDQDVVDEWVEGGVAAYGWKRPAARPPELDAPVRVNAKKAVAPVKKPGLFKRLKAKIVKPKPYVQPAAVPYLIPATPAVVTPPREPIDELLDPR